MLIINFPNNFRAEKHFLQSNIFQNVLQFVQHWKKSHIQFWNNCRESKCKNFFIFW